MATPQPNIDNRIDLHTTIVWKEPVTFETLGTTPEDDPTFKEHNKFEIISNKTAVTRVPYEIMSMDDIMDYAKTTGFVPVYFDSQHRPIRVISIREVLELKLTWKPNE